MKWNVGLPGGMNGPFYSVVASNGKVIAMQIPELETAELIASLGDILDCDFDVIGNAGQAFMNEVKNDGVKDIPPGIDHYILRTAVYALFGSAAKRAIRAGGI